MRSTFFAFCILSSLLLSARAELQFPEFAKLTPAEQQSWGYTTKVNERPTPTLTVSLSPAAAKAYQGARLFLRESQTGAHSETKPTESRLPDGSISLVVSLAESFRGSAELVVFSHSIPGAFITPNFGGFTFWLSSPQPK
jgi:hypothetical protein